MIKTEKSLQVILGPFTCEIHNMMLNTSIGSFLFGVVMMLKATPSAVQVLKSRTVSFSLTDNCPMALDIKDKKTANAQLSVFKSLVAHGNLGLQIHSNSVLGFVVFSPRSLTLHI